MRILAMILVAFKIAVVPLPARAADLQWLGPGDLIGLGQGNGADLSADGTTAAFMSSNRWMRWTLSTGLQEILAPGFPNAVSANGGTIVGVRGGEPVRWTAAAGAQVLPPGLSNATGTSADGEVIAGYLSQSAHFAWVVTVAGAELLPLSYYSFPMTVSADGHVIAGYSAVAATQGVVRWTRNPLVPNDPYVAHTLGQGSSDPLVCYSAVPTALSSNGSTMVGGGASCGAWRWTEASGFTNLGNLGSIEAQAYDLSADGSQIVGYARQADMTPTAFLWTAAQGMRPLSVVLGDLGLPLNGATLSYAVAISANGSKVLGFGRRPTDTTDQAFIATLTPSGSVVSVPALPPWSLALLGLALCLLAVLRRELRRSCD